MNTDIIAERKLWLADLQTGTHTNIRIEIGRPRWTEPETEAACSVFVEGLMSQPIDIFGADSINALECALRFVDSEVKSLADGQQVQWPGGEPYDDAEDPEPSPSH